MIRTYGTDAHEILLGDLGKDFGATLTESKVRWLLRNEVACTADDVHSRHSRLGLRMTAQEVATLENCIKEYSA